MSLRLYTLYSAAAAAASLATAQVLADGEVVGVDWACRAAPGNAVIDEISTTATRLATSNNPAQGPISYNAYGVTTAATAPEGASRFVPIASGCRVKVGDLLYLHSSQIGVGGTTSRTVTIYVREGR